MGKKISDTQSAPGWGFICATCKHTLPDDEKYVSFPPSIACKKVRYTKGGYDRSTMEYETPAPINELTQYADGSEKCPNYTASEGSDDET